jgi:hypothetical protein
VLVEAVRVDIGSTHVLSIQVHVIDADNLRGESRQQHGVGPEYVHICGVVWAGSDKVERAVSWSMPA